MKIINTILIGASALAYPVAAKLGADSLVVDGGFTAGAEFCDAMDAGKIDLEREYKGFAADYLAELKERDIVGADGGMHVLALGGVLAKRYLECGCEMLFGSAVTETSRIGGGILVTVFTPERGYSQYLAKNVIDTRVLSFMDAQKTFGVMLAAKSNMDKTDIRLFDDGDVYLQKGKFDDEYVLRFRVPRKMSVPDAEELADAWLKSSKDRLHGLKAASIALVFGYEFAAPLDFVRNNVRYVPSAAYKNAVLAVEGGDGICL